MQGEASERWEMNGKDGWYLSGWLDQQAAQPG